MAKDVHHYTRVPVETVALLLAVLLRRSGKSRARISDKTLRIIAHRKSLRGAFDVELRGWLEYYGIWFNPLDRGGWIMVEKTSLEGAQPIAANDFIKGELQKLNNGSLDSDSLLAEIGFAEFETDE